MDTGQAGHLRWVLQLAGRVGEAGKYIGAIINRPEVAMPIVMLIAIWFAAFPAFVFADANDELAACRRIIVRLGDDSKAPADQTCMGLSYAYGLNHKKDLAKAACGFAKRPSRTTLRRNPGSVSFTRRATV